MALGGTSYAVASLPANSVGNKQIRNRAVTDAKIRPHSLRARDFRRGDLPGRGLSGGFPDPAVGAGAITAGKLAAGSVTRTKLALTMVTASVPYQASSIEAITAQCPVGTQVVTGGAGVVGADQSLALNNLAAVSYSGPAPFGNGWHGEAFRTYTSPQVNSSYGLNVFAICLST